MAEQSDFAVWAIIEVMGHRTYAGRVTEQRIAGAGFVRVDIPEVDGKGGTAKMLGPRSIFAFHLTSEEIARQYVARGHEQVIDVFAKLGHTETPAISAGDWADEWDDGEDETADEPWSEDEIAIIRRAQEGNRWLVEGNGEGGAEP